MTAGLTLFDTAIGTCGIAWNDNGICGVQFPERTAGVTRARLISQHPDAIESEPPAEVQQAIERIVGLIAGEPDDLRDVVVDLAGASAFNRQVWELTRAVGPGQTTTYGEIAKQLGTPHASQQVGQALGHNPVPIIVPCHRVLGAGGKLVGFSAPGGVTTKLKLLAIEDAAPNGQPALF